jgi:hypothetical protein
VPLNKLATTQTSRVLLGRIKVNAFIDFLEISNRPTSIENNVSETGLCLHPQVKSLSSWTQSTELKRVKVARLVKELKA